MNPEPLTEFLKSGGPYLLLCVVELIVIAVLVGRIRRLQDHGHTLQKALEYEKLRGRCPYLTLARDDQEYQLTLTNDSYCYAKNIQVHDASMVVDVGFQKRLTLKFEMIEMIKPQTSAQLQYKAFDGEQDVTNHDPGKLIHYFPNSGLELTLTCQNMEGDPFREVIVNQKADFVVREVKPVAGL